MSVTPTEVIPRTQLKRHIAASTVDGHKLHQAQGEAAPLLDETQKLGLQDPATKKAIAALAKPGPQVSSAHLEQVRRKTVLVQHEANAAAARANVHRRPTGAKLIT